MGNATKFHPHTGEPIRPLWIRPDGRAMWPILGASPDDPPPADPPPSDPPPTDPPSDPQKEPDDGKGGKDAILADLAKERDKRQELEQRFADAEKQRGEQMDSLAKALGLKPDDTPADPAKLAEQISAEQQKTTAAETRATSAERQLAVFKAAMDPEVDANAVALLDSTSFLTSIADVDHTDVEKVTEAIKAAVEKNPLFKGTPATPPFNGGPRTPAPTGAGTLGEAIANKMAAPQR